jgi:CrcB protein
MGDGQYDSVRAVGANIAWVALGGALGSVARYLVGVAAGRAFPLLAFPLGTLLVNVPGCFLIGLVHQLALQTARVPQDVRLFLTTGILGGFTTYSSFDYELTDLARRGAWGLSAAYLGLTVAGGLVAGIAGIACAGWIATRGG